jgi:DNA-binding MurR/RpiR family transcriptional regulator
MEVKIGVVYTSKELLVELDGDADEIVATFDKALEAGDPVVWLTDNKGRKVGVPADKVAYIEVSKDDETKRVGFSR